MPANLPPDYYAAERRYRETQDPHEKIRILREMLAIMPKHKGTEHLQGDLKKKIAKLSAQAQKKKGACRASGLDHIPREGAGQAVLVGLPNVGKSTILTTLTHASSDVADYPFSTFKPVQGMMPYEDIQIQLVDLPPLSVNHTESWLFNIIRLADLVVLIVDLSLDNPDKQVLDVCSLLDEHKIELRQEGERRPQASIAVKSTLIIGNKADARGAMERGESLIHKFGDVYPWVLVSFKTGSNVDALKTSLFKRMHIIRVYTKAPGKKTERTRPYVLYKGSTVFRIMRGMV